MTAAEQANIPPTRAEGPYSMQRTPPSQEVRQSIADVLANGVDTDELSHRLIVSNAHRITLSPRGPVSRLAGNPRIPRGVCWPETLVRPARRSLQSPRPSPGGPNVAPPSRAGNDSLR